MAAEEAAMQRWFRMTLVLMATIATSVARAQTPVVMPGTAFVADYPPAVKVDDVPDGRRFAGKAFAKVVIRAKLAMPAPGNREYRLQRLVVHFRTERSGVSLRAIELRRVRNPLRKTTNLSGDYTRQERENVVDFGDVPVAVTGDSLLYLELQFPGGFDSKVDPGAFVVTSVALQFADH
jgi:hypothetical protein